MDKEKINIQMVNRASDKECLSDDDFFKARQEEKELEACYGKELKELNIK